MLPGNIVALPLAIMLVFSNQSRPYSHSEWDENDADGEGRPPTRLPVPGRWSTSPWGSCSNPCGPGEERRQVSCVLEDVTSTLIVAVDGLCAPPKPAITRECHQFRDECLNAWFSGDWGQCSARCGGGRRSRLVECHAGATAAAADSRGKVLPDARCVAELRPAARKDCNLQPCPDGRRIKLLTSDGVRRRIPLFTKFSLRCPILVHVAPSDDRSKRRYAWFKDGQKLPLHEDKYTQVDNRGELRIKGADEPDSGIYKCAPANRQGEEHNVSVILERIPGEPTVTVPPSFVAEDDDVDYTEEREDVDVTDAPSKDVEEPAVPVSPQNESVTPRIATSTSAAADAVTSEKTDTNTEPPSAFTELPSSSTEPPSPSTELPSPSTELLSPSTTELPSLQAEPPPHGVAAERHKRDLTEAEQEATEAPSSSGTIVVAARYDVGPFSDCSASCGAAGRRQRVVRCVDNETEEELPISACEDLGPQPPQQLGCNHVDCPRTWQWPSWAGIKCSRRCGGGTKWRQALCSQTLANGTELALSPSACATLGPGEERLHCHRAPCRSRVREGEVIKLECRAANGANVTWRHNASLAASPPSIDLNNTDKYFADDKTGLLYVFGATPDDAGQYICVEEADGVTSSHRFEVAVVPPLTPQPRGQDDDLFVRDWEPITPRTEVSETVTTDETDADTTTGPDAELAERPAVPWHLILTPAAPSKGRILGIFT